VKTIQVKVKPNARRSALEPTADGSWLARVASPAREGKANRELISLVAERFGVRRDQVSIKVGAAGRIKLVQIDG
jgi:uncharacterized protein